MYIILLVCLTRNCGRETLVEVPNKSLITVNMDAEMRRLGLNHVWG